MKACTAVLCAGLMALGVVVSHGCSVEDRAVRVAQDASTGGTGNESGTVSTGGSAGSSGSGGRAGTGGTGTVEDSGGTPDTGSDAGVPLESFCSILMPSLCEWVTSCLKQPRCTDWNHFTRIQAICVAAPAAVAAGRLRYDPIQAETCLAAVDPRLRDGNAALCSGGGTFLAWTLTRDIDNECTNVFTGLVPIGGDCYSQSSLARTECLDGVCAVATGVCPGKCAPYRTVGQACGSPGEHCDPTTYCNVNSCAERRAADAVCNSDSECQRGMICAVLADGGTQKQCVTIGQKGDNCRFSAGCDGFLECIGGTCVDQVPSGGPCKATNVCPTGEVCVFGSPIKKSGTCALPLPSGSRCGRDEDCAGYDRNGSSAKCLSPDGTAPPVCRPPAGPSEPCGGTPCPGPCGVIDCGPGLYCEPGPASVCKPRPTSGSACTLDPQCASGLMCMCLSGPGCLPNGTCLPPGDYGQPCDPRKNSPPSCLPGLFCERGTKTCTGARNWNQPCTPFWPSCVSEGTTHLYCSCNGAACKTTDVDWTQPSATESCQFKITDGFGCTAGEQCLNGYCVNGKCASFPAFSFCDGIDDLDAGAADAR